MHNCVTFSKLWVTGIFWCLCWFNSEWWVNQSIFCCKVLFTVGIKDFLIWRDIKLHCGGCNLIKSPKNSHYFWILPWGRFSKSWWWLSSSNSSATFCHNNIESIWKRLLSTCSWNGFIILLSRFIIWLNSRCFTIVP